MTDESGKNIFDSSEGWNLPSPEATLWPWIAGFVFLQGTLILAIIRLRDHTTV
jgi:hypothetical protein